MIKIRIPDSISAMVYNMKHPYLWTLMVWAIAAIGYTLMVSKSEQLIPLAFASCACISFVGCMPLIKGEHNTLHWVFGITGCVLSQLWCILVAGICRLLIWWWLWCVLVIILICIQQARTWCFWLEIWCMMAVTGTSVL